MRAYSRIVVFTGAGVSVASGLRPYRGPGGLWTEEGHQHLAFASALRADPASVWRFFGAQRNEARGAKPNAAHEALAAYEQRFDDVLRVLTQNVDGLHQRAGSRQVVELHGNILETRCTQCARPAFADDATHLDGVPSCDACGAVLRPNVVLFDEPLSAEADHEAKRAMRDCELFIAVGTSVSVSTAVSLLRAARFERAQTIWIDVAPGADEFGFDEIITGRAEDVLPSLLQ